MKVVFEGEKRRNAAAAGNWILSACAMFALPQESAWFGDKPQMALTPFRIVILLVSTLVLSILGIVLIVAGVHGPQAVAMIGGFLLLPSVILTRLGVPVGIPLMQSMSMVSILIFIVLQTAYYYALLQFICFVTSRSRRHSRAG